jgi:membrane protein DedA with SNARE-associated domain
VNLLGAVEHYIHEYGYFAVSGGILLEDFGLPTPGETLLIAAALAASKGALNIVWLLPLAWIAAVIGDNIGWAIGHYGGHRLMVRYGGRIGITADKLKSVEAMFDRYGDYVVVFARFVVVLRQFNGIVAGTLEMHWARFLVLNALGAALWVAWWGLLAYFLGREVFEFISGLAGAEYVLFTLAGVAALAVIGRVLWRRRTLR